MAESFCRVGDIEICYETFGDRGDPAILMIMGLGTQMVAWHDEFCAQLAGRGYFVIRFDNRDIGRSTHLDGAPTPSLLQLAVRDKRAAAYTLADMASDSVGVLDHLGIDKAHIVGASMGGMIAQTIAIRHPHRTLSLVSIMSNTGGFFAGQPALTMYAVLLKPSPRDRDGFIEHGIDLFTKIGGSGFEPDIEDLREIATRSYDRGHDPQGSQRQLAAIIADRDRSPQLRRLTIPAAVIHGADDKLVRPSGGRATAKAIPGAKLLEIKGMGHGLPRGAWDQIIGAITDTAARGEAAAAALTPVRG
jgi:pimeloyl-ACP methyl ester carboxylesterase